MEKTVLQIYLDNAWRDAAVLQVHAPGQGYLGDCDFAYLVDYAVDRAGLPFPAASVGCQYPVDFEYRRLPRWPAFLLDILPAGAGRVHWIDRLGLADDRLADWPLLLNGAGNPPGNLRIAGAIDRREQPVPRADGQRVANKDHPGFARDDILERQEHFIEYAAQNGAHVAGCSDVQGVAPKFLLQQDAAGRWHAEGALTDAAVCAHWIIKFPRGRTEDDRRVLRNEAPYMEVARAVGLRTHAQPTVWEHDALFVPRFDRVVTTAGIVRFGMESLYSLAGIAEYGARVSQNLLAGALAEFVTEPSIELREFVRRDVLNIALGNKDNHGRNSAVLRMPDGTVALTPLFDVAPMYLDPEGIARVCRWEGEAEVAGQPIWGRVAEVLPVDDVKGFRADLAEWATVVERLPDHMRACGVDDDITEQRALGIAELVRALRDAKPRAVVIR